MRQIGYAITDGNCKFLKFEVDGQRYSMGSMDEATIYKNAKWAKLLCSVVAERLNPPVTASSLKIVEVDRSTMTFFKTR